MLILHLVGEFGGLEEALPIPRQGSNGCRRGGQGCNGGQQPLVEEGQVGAAQHHFPDVVYQAVVFRVEHAVDAGEGNVFVAPSVARDVVEI